jgi:hypothetical protein
MFLEYIVTFIRYAQSQKIGKPNNKKVFGNKKTRVSQKPDKFAYIKGYAIATNLHLTENAKLMSNFV